MVKKKAKDSTYYKRDYMKLITNTSMQSWSIPFTTPNGTEEIYMTPKQSIKVPASYINEYVIRYQKRSLISIRNA